MATIQDLLSSTQKFKPKLFKNARGPKLVTLRITRFKGTRTLLFTGTSKDPATQNLRTVQMQFVAPPDVDIQEFRPSIFKDRVLVRCSSPWYKYAFGYNNKRIKAQFGRVSTFRVKGTGRPVNPKNFPGVDKHLISMIRALIATGSIR